MVLALFHTVFNVLGVVLLWPFTPRLVAWLHQQYRTEEEDESKPKYLDETVAATPALAMNALLREINRIGVLARHTAVTALMHGKEYRQTTPKPGRIDRPIGRDGRPIYHQNAKTPVS